MKETPNAAAAPREMKGMELLWDRVKRPVAMWRDRHIPYLVWRGQEIDVRVTFKEARIPDIVADTPDEAAASAFKHLKEGHLPAIRRALADIGVEFDCGIGADGHDWEWDWSLRGPISVKFTGPARKPERRR